MDAFLGLPFMDGFLGGHGGTAKQEMRYRLGGLMCFYRLREDQGAGAFLVEIPDNVGVDKTRGTGDEDGELIHTSGPVVNRG